MTHFRPESPGITDGRSRGSGGDLRKAPGWPLCADGPTGPEGNAGMPQEVLAQPHFGGSGEAFLDRVCNAWWGIVFGTCPP